MTEVELIEQAVLRVGMKSLMNHGAASCVYTEGCEGVSQEHLIAFAREVALHCVAALTADVAAVREELARTERNRDMWKGQCERQAEQLAALRSQPPAPGAPGQEAAAADARDAARYRWLRAQTWDAADMFVVAGGKSVLRLGTYCPSRENLDQKIDAAREKTS